MFSELVDLTLRFFNYPITQLPNSHGWSVVQSFPSFMAKEDSLSFAQNSIRSLEKLKDRIIALYNASTHLDQATRNIWCDDAEGMYYRIVNADAISRSGDPDAVRSWLDGASSRYQQVSSELRALGEEGERLEKELKQVFALCHAAVSSVIPAIPIPATAPARVIRQSANNYILPCSVCGKRAVAVHPPDSGEKILKGITCAGIVRAFGIDVQLQDRIFAALEKGDLASLHHFLETEQDIEGGLDAYCPQCDKIYCHSHYSVQERWDEGFYDCAYGTCPQGHRRKIDD